MRHDVSVAVELGSKHISPYCLTVPEGHPLSKNRPLEDEQVEMFNIIDDELRKKSFTRYELSNYALQGFESQHNLLYWTDQDYWGLGLSAHSSSKKSEWGSRFWNANSFDLYCQQMQSEKEVINLGDFEPKQIENLKKAQSLTDYCYTALRLQDGLAVEKLVQKFGPSTLGLMQKSADSALKQGHMVFENGHFKLTSSGFIISNQIFEKFAFFEDDLT